MEIQQWGCVRKGRRDLAGESVVVEPELLQVGHGGEEGVRDGAGEGVAGEVEGFEGFDPAEIWDRAGEGVVDEAECSEGGEMR